MIQKRRFLICDFQSNFFETYKLIFLFYYSILCCLEETFKKLIPSLDIDQRAYIYQITISCHLLIRLGLEHTDTEAHIRKSLRLLRIQAFDLLSSVIKFRFFY